METTDLLKEPILTATNGAHDSSKEVDGLEVTENVSDLKEPSALSKKESSPVINKEFSSLPDRKELSPEPLRKEESSIHSSKESSPLPLSKESSPLLTRKESEETSNHEDPLIHSNESLPLLHLKEDPLQSKKNISPLPVASDNPLIGSAETFVISESIETSSKPTVSTDTLLQKTANDKEGTDLVTSSSETKVFPTSVTPEPPHESEIHVAEAIKKEEETFGFNKPLPPEPIESTVDFLKSETTFSTEENDMKPMTPKVIADDDFVSDTISSAKGDEDVATRKSSPSPPPVPKHQNLREDSIERYEPSQTPEPDFAAFKPVSGVDDKFGETVEIPEPVVPAAPVSKPDASPKSQVSTPKPEETTEAEVTIPKPKVSSEPEETFQPTVQPKKVICPKKPTEVIGAKDIRGKIDAWFNPARLHPQVESLIYWRDPKKSGIVFGITMVSLLSLIYYSLISVVAYLCLFTLGGTITFRIYKNVMQAVQKTSDGHPFKDLLEVDLTIPEDKVSEVSQCLVQYLNTSLTTLRSLFLVEDLIDSIKFVVILWVLTYVGACFNGLTLIIIGVILLFSLPKVYENNKAQIDVYMKMAMDKLSIITNRMKAAVPEGKKDDKPKDQ